MHLLPYSLTLSCFLSLATHQTLAAPSPSPPLPRSIPLLRKPRSARNNTEWLLAQKAHIEGKYTAAGKRKRASGFNLYVLRSPFFLSPADRDLPNPSQPHEPKRRLKLLRLNSRGHPRHLLQRHSGHWLIVRLPFSLVRAKPLTPRHRDLWLAASDGLSTTTDGIPTFDSNCTSVSPPDLLSLLLRTPVRRALHKT